ncbi:hypothetical protein ACTXT7_009522 [Hymenolepis weldensis]
MCLQQIGHDRLISIHPFVSEVCRRFISNLKYGLEIGMDADNPWEHTRVKSHMEAYDPIGFDGLSFEHRPSALFVPAINNDASTAGV